MGCLTRERRVFAGGGGADGEPRGFARVGDSGGVVRVCCGGVRVWMIMLDKCGSGAGGGLLVNLGPVRAAGYGGPGFCGFSPLESGGEHFGVLILEESCCFFPSTIPLGSLR